MKAGVRAFGCCLIVAGANDGLFRIDPSGTVTKLDDNHGEGIAFAGRGDGEKIIENVKQKIEHLEKDEESTLDTLNQLLIETLKNELSGGGQTKSQYVICASLKPGKNAFYGISRIPVDRKDGNTAHL